MILCCTTFHQLSYSGLRKNRFCISPLRCELERGSPRLKQNPGPAMPSARRRLSQNAAEVSPALLLTTGFNSNHSILLPVPVAESTDTTDMVVESLPFWLAASSLLGLLLYGAGKLVRARILVPKFTILHDIQTAGRPREDGKIPGRAIVCGGRYGITVGHACSAAHSVHLSHCSVAGLLAAAVCADHFESVFVVEPEQWANEHGTDLPQDQSYRTLPDGHKEPIVARTRIMQYTALHCESMPRLSSAL